MEEVVYTEKPNLNKPYLIIGFEGWPNAGEVSSYALQHLVDSLKAKRFASIPTENFYQISSLRPMAVIKEGRLIELKSPGNHFYYVKAPLLNDLILFYGAEPHLLGIALLTFFSTWLKNSMSRRSLPSVVLTITSLTPILRWSAPCSIMRI
jgi:proteasome assembly chaperone (PAC2) family protein